MAKRETNPLVDQLGEFKELTRTLKAHGVVYCYDHNAAMIYIKSILPYLEKVAVLREWDESFSPWNFCLFPVSDMTSFCTKYRKTTTDIQSTDTTMEMKDEKKEAELTLHKLQYPTELVRLYDTCYQKLFCDQTENDRVRDITDFFYENVSTPMHSIDTRFAQPWNSLSEEELLTLKEKQSICIQDAVYGEQIYLSKPIFGDVKKTEEISYIVLPPDIEGESGMRVGKRYALFRQREPKLHIYTLLSFASIQEDQ